MTISEILAVASTVTLSFGGGAVIVIGLSGWLGNIWAKRIVQNESAALQRKLEELRHEMALTKSSYEHYLDLILNYYSTFYQHYRLCQKTAAADAHLMPDGKEVHTKDEFLTKIDHFLNDWADQEGAASAHHRCRRLGGWWIHPSHCSLKSPAGFIPPFTCISPTA